MSCFNGVVDDSHDNKHLLGSQVIVTGYHRTSFEREAFSSVNVDSVGVFHRGMLACFFQGLTCFLLASTSRSLQIFLRVVAGSMMSSTKPKNKHLASQRRVCNVLYCCIQFEQTQTRALRESCKKCDIVYL